ncbi:PIN domain-containing protein [Rhodococcus rhodochrous]|uniref:Uncharacterized protein n=1 Tax=Rhodococcus rhodochrous KG-21 TaxID=1441923 RepID=A0A0M8PJU7_RHORH|nr:PIN domain-containing protein [Rhodococcus rhodochrous]KOS53158.1 hypothetical protein Z051_27095 [Rhodococcus rhodochrous KG-21]
MTPRPIIDAGPALNFFAVDRERLLFSVTGPLSTPETVRDEVFGKARSDRRFKSVERVWRKIPDRFLEVLPDDPTPELVAVLGRISQQPWEQRRATAKDLGETMVVAHAVVKAQAGHQVTVIIDDRGGAELATNEIRRLDRLRSAGKSVGSIMLVNTLTILERAAGTTYLPDRKTMREVYDRLRGCDDGLVPIGKTQLLSTAVWR